MNSTLRSPKCFVPLALSWSHCGVSYRVTPWPEARFERLYGEDWIVVSRPSVHLLRQAHGTLAVLRVSEGVLRDVELVEVT